MGISAGPDIITDGLVLELDAGDRNSYPGTGTTWRDLSGNSNNGTLTNGPTFNTGSLGNIVFDGVDDYTSVTHSTSLNITETFTISCWIYPTRINNPDYIMNKNDAWGLILGFQSGNVNFYNNAYQPTAAATQISVSLNQWVNVVYSKDLNSLSNNWNGYKNGSSVFTLTRSFTNSTNSSNLLIGSSQTNLNFYRGNIASVQIYNKALSSQEILQNYTAMKTRFGL